MKVVLQYDSDEERSIFEQLFVNKERGQTLAQIEKGMTDAFEEQIDRAKLRQGLGNISDRGLLKELADKLAFAATIEKRQAAAKHSEDIKAKRADLQKKKEK